MKMIEVRKISTTDLTVQTTKLREEIVELRRKIHQGEITNVRLLRQKRKDLARMLTVLSEQLSKEKM
jgi:ribosomal protein L29